MKNILTKYIINDPIPNTDRKNTIDYQIPNTYRKNTIETVRIKTKIFISKKTLELIHEGGNQEKSELKAYIQRPVVAIRAHCNQEKKRWATKGKKVNYLLTNTIFIEEKTNFRKLYTIAEEIHNEGNPIYFKLLTSSKYNAKKTNVPKTGKSKNIRDIRGQKTSISAETHLGSEYPGQRIIYHIIITNNNQ